MLWVLIRIAQRGDSNEHQQQSFFDEMTKLVHAS